MNWIIFRIMFAVNNFVDLKKKDRNNYFWFEEFCLYNSINFMKMNLRIKILSGFFILAMMLLIAGAISIKEFLNIGQSVQSMLDENYRSINAANTMMEALDRENSGILQVLMGCSSVGERTIRSGDSLFSESFYIAQSNITIENESHYIQRIDQNYSSFQKRWLQLVRDTENQEAISWYYDNLHTDFLTVKNSVYELLELNQKTLYRNATTLKDHAYRSVIPGIVAIIASFVFAILFYFFINQYVIRPIIKMTHAVEDYNNKGKQYSVEVETKDELNELNNSIKSLLTNPKV